MSSFINPAEVIRRMIMRQGKVLKYSQFCNMQTCYFIICLLKMPVIVNTGITLLIHVYKVVVSFQCCWVSTTRMIINTDEIINKQAEISFLWRCISTFTAHHVQIPGKLWIRAIYSLPDQIALVAVMKLKAFFSSFTSPFNWSANRVPSTVSSL